ncbi:hypothetical protein [Streptomyces boluensis]|uniref:Uncharacterized protein n=1 Tax=Streptomyces boluensis TaxID=1775135 RepID=A0A964UQE7_9ACTN|nr:hypothetical protein [Streptomyces boluensis]NBE49890.1 hypothetical protein [Streptomyces boluensis]
MSRARAEVGDLVEDETGQRAIVTDIRHAEVWILRPPSGTTPQWETDDPDSLQVLEPRAVRARLRREQSDR